MKRLFSIIALLGIGLSNPLLKFLSPLGGLLALISITLSGVQFLRQPEAASVAARVSPAR